MFDLESYLSEQQKRIQDELEMRLPDAGTRPGILHEVMRYSVFNGGKRIRPILCLAAAEASGEDTIPALGPACAVEILHTYTLIHDDLPCMDDDDLRRGQPTAHIAYGEANAVLAGDALLTMAFEWLAEKPAPPPYIPTQMISELAVAAGSRGVIGGQVEDIAAEGSTPDEEQIRYIHAHKTGALFRASVRLGAIATGAAPCDLDQLTVYGTAVGKAFQIMDDVLNTTSTPEQMGKPTGNDAERGKATYVALLGLEQSKKDAKQLVDRAIRSLSDLPGDTGALEAIARFTVTRSF